MKHQRSMKYEKIYREKRHALGEPTPAFVSYFDDLTETKRVLDLGCGQGRDALFIARKGHCVTAVDISPTGITQLLEEAAREALAVEGVVADLRLYQPKGCYDVVVLDRTLHMLEEGLRLNLLARVASQLNTEGAILIADERKNLPALHDWFRQSPYSWKTLKNEKGLLFIQCL